MNLFFNEDTTEIWGKVESLLLGFEKVSLFLGLMGVAFWLSNFPNTDTFLTIGLLSVAFAYFLKTFYVKEKNKLSRVTYRLGYFGSAFTVVVVLFRFLFWEGYQVYAFGGILLLFLSQIIQLFSIKKSKNSRAESTENYRFFTRNNYRNLKFLFYLLIAIVSQTVSPVQLFEFRHSEDAEMIRLYRKTVENPDNNQYKKALEEYQKNKVEGKRFLPEPQDK